MRGSERKRNGRNGEEKKLKGTGVRSGWRSRARRRGGERERRGKKERVKSRPPRRRQASMYGCFLRCPHTQAQTHSSVSSVSPSPPRQIIPVKPPHRKRAADAPRCLVLHNRSQSVSLSAEREREREAPPIFPPILRAAAGAGRGGGAERSMRVGFHWLEQRSASRRAAPRWHPHPQQAPKRRRFSPAVPSTTITSHRSPSRSARLRAPSSRFAAAMRLP